MRILKIKDHGKDFGYCRYQMTTDSGRPDEEVFSLVANDPDIILASAERWLDEGVKKETINMADFAKTVCGMEG